MNSEQSSRSSRTYLEEVEPFVHSRSVTTHQTKEVIVDALTFVVTSYTDIPIILTTNSTLPQIVILNNTTPSQGVFESKLIIPLYVIIFLLAVIGNSLVLITLVQNKRMRTVTNVYLLNLAVSDLLLGVFCMPFTLVGQVLRNFIFGAAMCKLIPYFQAVSVSVGVWTLVAISLERYFAICRPLKSRRWQTQFHAYKMIAFVWAASLVWSAPVLVVSSLKAMKGRAKFKCREEWPSNSSEQAYNLFLDAMLLLVPLIIMSFSYSLIMSKLWKGLRREIQHNTTCQRQMIERTASSPTISDVSGKYKNTDFNSTTPLRQHRLAPPTLVRSNSPINSNTDQQNNKPRNAEKSNKQHTTETVKMWIMKGIVQVRLPKANNFKGYQDYTKTKTTTVVPRCELTTPTTEQVSNGECGQDCNVDETTYTFSRHVIRSNYMGKSIEAKKKVIRMLFVVVAEFFVCWAPLHVLNTWYLFYPDVVYKYVGSTGVSLVQLLAYVSSCCNPITYCFMNRKFRQAFLGVFSCYRVCCCCVCLDPDVADLQARGGLQRSGLNKVLQNNSDVSGNDSTLYVGRASTIGRSVSACPNFQKWWCWKPRIVFSSGSDCAGVSSSASASRLVQVIAAPPDDESFRYRITWIRPSPGGTNTPSCSSSSANLNHSNCHLYS